MKAEVKSKNFAVSFRDYFCAAETSFFSFKVYSVKSFFQTFVVMRKTFEKIVKLGFKNQFVFHGKRLAAGHKTVNYFSRILQIFFVAAKNDFVEFVKSFEIFQSSLEASHRQAQGHNFVDLNFSLYFHAVSMAGKPPVVKDLFFGFAKN